MIDMKYDDASVIRVSIIDGEKYIEWLATSYCVPDDDLTPWRFVDYKELEAPLLTVLAEGGVWKYECEYAEFARQIISDYDDEDLIFMYEKYEYEGEKISAVIRNEDVNESILPGIYAVLPPRSVG